MHITDLEALQHPLPNSPGAHCAHNLAFQIIGTAVHSYTQSTHSTCICGTPFGAWLSQVRAVHSSLNRASESSANTGHGSSNMLWKAGYFMPGTCRYQSYQ